MTGNGGDLLNTLAAVGELLSGLSAVALVIMTGVQLPFFRAQLISMERARQDAAKAEKERRTLDACNRFHTDVTLYEIKRHIFEAREKPDPVSALQRPEVRRDIINLLNYFEGLAIGIEQGVYADEIVYDNLRNATIWAVEYFVNTNAKYNPEGKLANPDDYMPLMRLYQGYAQRKIGLAAATTYLGNQEDS